jgi:hypothetical protein
MLVLIAGAYGLVGAACLARLRLKIFPIMLANLFALAVLDDR